MQVNKLMKKSRSTLRWMTILESGSVRGSVCSLSTAVWGHTWPGCPEQWSSVLSQHPASRCHHPRRCWSETRWDRDSVRWCPLPAVRPVQWQVTASQYNTTKKWERVTILLCGSSQWQVIASQYNTTHNTFYTQFIICLCVIKFWIQCTHIILYCSHSTYNCTYCYNTSTWYSS